MNEKLMFDEQAIVVPSNSCLIKHLPRKAELLHGSLITESYDCHCGVMVEARKITSNAIVLRREERSREGVDPADQEVFMFCDFQISLYVRGVCPKGSFTVPEPNIK